MQKKNLARTNEDKKIKKKQVDKKEDKNITYDAWAHELDKEQG